MAYGESATDRLAAVRAAIDRCLTSQEYQTAAGQRQRMAELATLRLMERDLQEEVAQQSGSIVSLGAFERR